MTRYIVMEAPGGPDRDHISTRFIADRFSPVALIAPWIWLLANRLWLYAASVFAVQIIAGFISALEGMSIFATAVAFGTGLLVSLEGRSLLARHLKEKGWTLRTVIHADDLETAEAIWFANTDTSGATAFPEAKQIAWAEMPAKRKSAGWRDDTSGLLGLDFSGGR